MTDAPIPDGYWQREASHNPRPLTPMGSSIFIDACRQAFPKVFSEFGLLAETLEYAEIGGYVYTRLKPLGGGGDRALPPAWILWLALRVHPAFRRRIAENRRAMRSRLDRAMLDRWDTEWRPRIIADIARLRAVDLHALTDGALADHFAEVRQFFFHTADVHFYLTAGNGFPLARLAWFCRDHLGYSTMDTMRLLSGLSGASSEPALRLADLAAQVRRDTALTDAILQAPPEGVLTHLRAHGGPIARAIDEYVHHFGFRALRYEVIEPTLDEQPDVLGRLLQAELARNAELRDEQERIAQARGEAKATALARLPDADARERFSALLREAERAYPVREDNEFYTVSVPLALSRAVVLAAGQRLATAGVVAHADDVFFLRAEEAIDALRAGGDLAPLVARRRSALREAEAFDPPASYGTEPARPPMTILPPEMREAMEAMIWVQDTVFGAEAGVDAAAPPAGVSEIRGQAAARGTYMGPACVIRGESEFHKLRPGDVLVCPITSPVWSILFANVGALVTDTGGVLSHPAIIAREYGIPAVVATRDATARIRDGQTLRVDGEAGLVEILA